MLSKAISLTAENFEGIYDKGGRPYILHCIHVMNKIRHLGDDYMMVAVMHDLIEDTDVTLADLKEWGFGQLVIDAIKAMTHLKGESYEDYIKRIKKNKIAVQVKLADLKHNSDITRMKGLEPKDFKRLEKYSKAYAFLRY